MGFNISGLNFVRREWEANNITNFIDEAKIEEAAANVKKRKIISV